ncbi:MULTISPECIES: hypothetical protein [unclassified Stygiolobus]|uniref:hypothetical protein n=1 Tax=unclassified Stygiolobus TaxID=2824672 RepID=UPI00307F22CD
MFELSEVRRFAELFIRMGLVRGEGGDYVSVFTECVEYLDVLLGDGRDGVFGLCSCALCVICSMTSR